MSLRLSERFRARPGYWAGLMLLAVLLAVGMGWYVWRRANTQEPPWIDTAGADEEVAAAIEAARAEVHRSPRSAAAWGKLGQMFVAHQYDDEAITCFMFAEKLDPTDAQWWYLHGLTLLFKDTNAAIVQFQRAVALQNDSPAMRLRLAEALLVQGRLDEAEEQYRELLALDPGNPRGRLGLARLAYRRSDLPASREYLGDALGSPMTQKAAHSLLAEIAQQANEPTAAARERLVASELPDDQDWFDPAVDEIDQLRAGRQARLDRALKALRGRGIAEGIGPLRQMVQDYPEWDRAWLNYGRVLFEHQEYAAAEDALRKALNLAPESVEARFQLGLTLSQRGNYSAAGDNFREATRLKPDHALAYYNLGHCLKRQGNRPAALEAFRAAARCKPNYAAAHANLGELLAEHGDKAEAEEQLRLAVKLNPDDANAQRLLEQLGQGK